MILKLSLSILLVSGLREPSNFNNQSGINNETLKKVRIILPDIDKQREFAGEVVSHYKKAIQLREQADREVSMAKDEFEKKILGE